MHPGCPCKERPLQKPQVGVGTSLSLCPGQTEGWKQRSHHAVLLARRSGPNARAPSMARACIRGSITTDPALVSW